MELATGTPPLDLRSLQERLRVIQSLRFAVVCTAVIVATALAGLSTGVVTLVPAIVLVLFLKDETFASSMAWLLGVILGAAFVFMNTYLFDQAPFIYLLLSMLLLFGLGYWTGQGLRGRWPYLAFPLGASFALLTAVFAEISGAADGVDAAFLWVKETPLGILILWIVLTGLWPSPTARDLANLVDATQRECATLLRQSIGAVAKGRPTTFVPSPLTLRYFGETARMLNLNSGKFAGNQDCQECLFAKLNVLSEIYLDIRYIQRSFEDLPQPGFDAETRAAAAQIMSALADYTDGKPLADLSAPLATIRRAEQTLSASATKDRNVRRLAARLAGFSVAAKELQQGVAVINAPRRPEPRQRTQSHTPIAMDSLQAAIKLIVGVLLGLLVIMMTQLPANAYLVVAILIVLAQPNVGRVHLRIRLWFPGVLAGSLWAIAGLVVLSYLPYFGIYLLWFLPGLFVAGYIGLGPDRISYAGMQLAVGLATILGMAAFPDDTLLTAEARTLGACIGFLIALGVYYVLWPVHPADQLRASLATNLREIAALLTSQGKLGDAPRDADRRAEVAGQILHLKSEIQADFGLLYDYSYMMSHTVRPAYDYRALTHAVGMMFSQIWCLQQSIDTPEATIEHQATLKPIRIATPGLTAFMEDLANCLELAQAARAEDVQPAIDDARKRLRALDKELDAAPSPQAREDIEAGINTVSLLWMHLQNFAEAMDTSREREPFNTAQLAELYEGAKS